MSYLWLEKKYARLVSPFLTQAKVKHDVPFLLNCRCPYCGDSKKHKNKTRGYIYENKGHLSFKCHNCSATSSFPTFLKFINASLYNDYTYEKLKEEPRNDYTPQINKTPIKRVDKFDHFKSLKKISQLRHDHPAKKYVLDRKIPSYHHDKLYYCPAFFAWVNTILPHKFSEEACTHDEPRLVIPYFDYNGFVFAFAGRSFNKKSQTKYITIKLDDTKPKIYGLDRVDVKKRIFVVEGPLDSLFLNNAIAMSGLDGRYDSLGRNIVIIFDNQPRNKEVVQSMMSAVKDGYSIVVWPPFLQEKDINDMAIANIDYKTIIENNIVHGLEAELKVMAWEKL